MRNIWWKETHFSVLLLSVGWILNPGMLRHRAALVSQHTLFFFCYFLLDLTSFVFLDLTIQIYKIFPLFLLAYYTFFFVVIFCLTSPHLFSWIWWFRFAKIFPLFLLAYYRLFGKKAFETGSNMSLGFFLVLDIPNCTRCCFYQRWCDSS